MDSTIFFFKLTERFHQIVLASFSEKLNFNLLFYPEKVDQYLHFLEEMLRIFFLIKTNLQKHPTYFLLSLWKIRNVWYARRRLSWAIILWLQHLLSCQSLKCNNWWPKRWKGGCSSTYVLGVPCIRVHLKFEFQVPPKIQVQVQT